MLDGGVELGYRDPIHALWNLAGPRIPIQRSQSTRYRFVQTFSIHLHAVLDAIDVGDLAGAWHDYCIGEGKTNMRWTAQFPLPFQLPI